MAVQESQPSAQARIARPALAQLLNRALDAGPVLLIAGGGCGKTVALEEALSRRGVTSVWVGCDEGDRDAGRLVRRFADELRHAVPGAVDPFVERLAVAQERVDVAEVGESLVAELERLLVDEVVIAFDDAEYLCDSPEAAAVVGRMLATECSALRTVVASRSPLPLRLAKLRSSGRLVELGPAELAFDPAECAQLLRLVRGAAGEVDAEELFAATEGWPLGAALGALHGEIGERHGTPSQDRLFDFLREQVLEALSPSLRRALVDSGVPAELNDGCVRALELPSDFVEQALRAGLPLRSVQREEIWFAYHPLVRKFLGECLAAERPREEVRGLNARVASALTESGQVERAIEHWLAAEEWRLAADAIRTAASPLVHTAPGTVWRWLEALPTEERAAASVRLLEGTLQWGEGERVRAIDSLTAAGRGFKESQDVVGEWLARFALADPLFVSGEFERVIELADGFDDVKALAAGVAPPAVAAYAAAAAGAVGRGPESEELSTRLLAHPNSGMLRPARTIWELHRLLTEGDFELIMRGLEEAVSEFKRFDPINRLPTVAALFAQTLGDQGRDAEALEHWEEVEKVARRAHTTPVLWASFVWRALLHARAERLRPAEDCLARGAKVATGMGMREHAFQLACARIAGLRGDRTEALSAGEKTLALAKRAPLADRFQAVVDVAPVLVEVGAPDAAWRAVDEDLAVCDERLPGRTGRFSRSLLLGLRAWLRHVRQDETGSLDDLARMWDAAGPNAPDVVRRDWRLLERLLWRGLEAGALDPSSVIGAIESAWPGGDVLLSFTEHPHAAVRRAAVPATTHSGNPSAIARLGELARDPDAQVAAAAAAAMKRMRTAPPPLVFELLGPFRVRRGSWQVEDSAWDRRVAQRVVRYLLVNRGSLVPDDLLLETFWSGVPQETARKRLKVAVSCARAVLDVPGTPSVIEVTERALALRLRARDSVDVDRFEEISRTALGAAGADQRQLLERAIALWTGEPLPEERDADWATLWREHLTVRYAEVLNALVAACHSDGDHLAATDAARKLVEVDPLDESAQRLLITAYARSGMRAHALRQYLECRRRLVDELGVEPASDTMDVQRRVLAGDPI
jgi:DNA-binding SARP family transcriptional activator